MKTYSVVHVLVLLLLLLAYQCAAAQDYVISTRGDSIAGEVKPMTFGADKKVQVVADGKKTVLPLVQVKSYRYRDEIFHPVKGDQGYQFMKVIRNGYLSLYAFQLPGQTNFDGLYLVKRDGSRIEVPNLGFKKYMVKLLEDCASVAEKIESGEYNKKKLLQIVDDYNSCVSQRTGNHNQPVVKSQEQARNVIAWNKLEEKIRAKPEFSGKTDALEMISDIKGKINRSEKVPNFLIEGLKSSLANADVNDELETALAEIRN